MKSYLKTIVLLFFNIIFIDNFGQDIPLGTEYVGNASYYGKEFYGNKTASGEILSIDELTCAHPTLPFGTMLEVTNLRNNKWVVVRVNDRGPHVKGRIIDVTHASAKALGMFGEGISKVKLVIVGDGGTVYISRPQTLIENTADLLKDEPDSSEIPLKNKNDDDIDPKHRKSVAKKRANRRKGE